MVGARTATAVVGIVGSLALSVVLYLYTGSLLFFLFVPFVPFLFRGSWRDGSGERAESTPRILECPQCGFRTTDPEYEYCPRDGRRLHTPRNR